MAMRDFERLFVSILVYGLKIHILLFCRQNIHERFYVILHATFLAHFSFDKKIVNSGLLYCYEETCNFGPNSATIRLSINRSCILSFAQEVFTQKLN
jgi:hypothetical protein